MPKRKLIETIMPVSVINMEAEKEKAEIMRWKCLKSIKLGIISKV